MLLLVLGKDVMRLGWFPPTAYLCSTEVNVTVNMARWFGMMVVLNQVWTTA